MATTSAALVACQTCGFASAPGTPTCPYCGVDPAYVTPDEEPVTYDGLGRAVLSTRTTMEALAGGVGFIGLVTLIVAAIEPDAGLGVWMAAIAMLIVGAIGLRQMQRRYRPRRQTTGTLRQAEERLDAALADARTRRARLDALHAHAPASTDHGLATRTLADAARVLDARIGALERARFDLRLVWWKNRVDLALARRAAGEVTAHDTFTALAALRAEATTALATLGPARAEATTALDALGPARADAYADVRPRLAAANDALGAYTARVYDASVAEAVAGIAAPLSEASVVRAEVDAALDRLAVLAEAAPAAARADALTRESARIALEADDLDPADDRTASGDARDVGRRRVRA